MSMSECSGDTGPQKEMRRVRFARPRSTAQSFFSRAIPHAFRRFLFRRPPLRLLFFPLGRLCWILIQLAFVRNPLFLLDSHEYEVETEDSERIKTSKARRREKKSFWSFLSFLRGFLLFSFLYFSLFDNNLSPALPDP